MDVESLAKELILKNMTPEQQMAVLDSVRSSVAQAKEVQKRKIGENVDLVVQALKKIESDIRSRFDDVGNSIEKRVASIKDGRDGINGKDGRDGKDGKSGRDGLKGDKGDAGRDGRDGVDGVDGVSVTDARIDFDGSLIITLSNGVELNVGEVVAPDLAEHIKVITNGGGTSQSVLDTLASLQTQINNLIPSQTGNSGKYLTTNGTALSWASIAGGGLSYQGTWNASTNTPTLASSTGTNGYYYIVSTAGSTNLNGITDWQIGDWLLFNGTVWQKIDQSNLVTSVAGRTGDVVLSNTDISGLGTMSTQNANSVAITGGTESAVSHSGDTITNYLNWTGTSAPSYQEGRVWYDSTAKAIAYYNDVSSVTVHIGHDLQFKVINNTGSTIPNGSPVYITGTSSGQTYPNVALAKADVASTSTVIGLTDGAIANGSVGYVTSTGNIDGVNTGTFTVGQVLYLSPYSAGQLMNTIPPTGITVQVGMVTYVDSSNGKIYVKQTTPLNVPASIISGAVAISNGGTGQITQQAAINALAGAVTSGYYPRGNGTNVVMSAIQAGDVPTLNQNTTGTAAGLSGSQTANYVYAAPNGSSGTASFRAIVAADIPTLNQNTTGTASNVTGTVAIANGGTGQTTANTAFNALAPSQSTNSGKYLTTDGTNTSWASVVAGASISNDTSTSSNLYPLFASATSGTPTTIYTSNAKYLYKPSTGELQSSAVVATNGIFVNSQTISTDYTIASGNNGMSAGTVSVANGVTVTIADGSVWTVV